MSIETESTSQVPESELVEFIVNLEYDDIPDEAIRVAERCFLDTIGVTLSGIGGEPGRIATQMVDTAGSTDGEATVIGTGMTASATDAAFVNGTAAHALDFDDSTPARTGHPSSPMLPAVLAIGEIIRASGPDLLVAYVAGFEAQHYVGSAIYPHHEQVGWHSTGTIGTFGAAAATANLLGLDTDQTRNAISIAASMPAGLQRNFGTMVKPMHAGQAARSGVTAALLAKEGFIGDETAVSGDHGFLDLYRGSGPVDESALPTLGKGWAILNPGIQVKKYPCCNCAHSAIAVTSELVDAYDIDPEVVESVQVTASEKAKQMLIHTDPQTGFEGKFSMPYTVACAVVRDRIDLDAFDDESINNPVVQRIRERVVFESNPELSFNDYSANVVIKVTSGTQYENYLENPPGRGDNPLSESEINEKFMHCAQRTIDYGPAREVCEQLNGLREQDADDVEKLLNHLQ